MAVAGQTINAAHEHWQSAARRKRPYWYSNRGPIAWGRFRDHFRTCPDCVHAPCPAAIRLWNDFLRQTWGEGFIPYPHRPVETLRERNRN